MLLNRIAYYSHIINSKLKLITYQQLQCVHQRVKHTYEVISSRENAIVRDYMKNSGKYVLWPIPSADWSKFLPTQSRRPVQKQYCDKHNETMHLKLINHFRIITEMSRTYKVDIKSNAFETIQQELINALPKFTELNLIELLKIFSEITIDPNDFMSERIVAFRTALSNECVSRCKQWDINHLCLMCDIWYGIPMGQHTHFLEVACEIFAQHANTLTSEQLIQVLFYLNWRRRPVRHMLGFEQQLYRHFQDLNLNELSIFAMGFTKTNTVAKNSNLISNIYEKLLQDDLRVLPEVSLTAILKVKFKISSPIVSVQNEKYRYFQMLRLSSQWKIHNKLNDGLQNKLIWHAENQSLLTALHIGLLGTTLHICSPQILEIVVERFTSHIKELRLKDMERIAMALALFDFRPETGANIKLLETIVNELPNRFESIRKHPQSYIMCIYYLALIGHANTDLITYCLTSAHLETIFGKIWKYPREILFLDAFTRINLKNSYVGPQLNSAQRKILTECLYNDSAWHKVDGQLNNFEKIQANVAASVRTVYKYFKMGRVLPHYANTGKL